MRGETDDCGGLTDDPTISIHSPHARGDINGHAAGCPTVYFNPLPSCEGRPIAAAVSCKVMPFQSTPLTRGETFAFLKRRLTAIEFQSTPLIRGETLVDGSRRNLPRRFQSTPLMRGETRPYNRPSDASDISIHSPHARGDVFWGLQSRNSTISIRSPHARGDYRP